MPFILVRKDITAMRVDAIVNAANTALRAGGGVCGAIFRAAGEEDLAAACETLAPIRTGDAVVTPGFGLSAKIIIHTAGPIYRDGNHGEEDALRACYENSLRRAAENACRSVAFPLISSGIYGYPKADALRVAKSAIARFLADHDMTIYLAVLDKTVITPEKIPDEDVRRYIAEHYTPTLREDLPSARHYEDWASYAPSDEDMPEQFMMTAPRAAMLDAFVGNLDEPFATTLLRLIDAKGLTDAQVYKRANIDRKLFSKIRSIKGYTPRKKTVVALAFALELSLADAKDLLKRTGFALSDSSKFDLIVKCCFEHKIYEIYEINEVLFKYDQPTLGG